MDVEQQSPSPLVPSPPAEHAPPQLVPLLVLLQQMNAFSHAFQRHLTSALHSIKAG